MREILLRGKKAYNGKWIEGYFYSGQNNDSYIIIHSKGYPSAKFIRVLPETVGQYTGLTDKNGKKIFEGDILEGDLDDNLDPGARWRSIVVWGTFGWMCKDRQCLPMDEFDILEGEVIGNIHDNPELLER